MKESNHLTKRTEPCLCCNECVSVVKGEWAFNRVQWNYCTNKFGLPKLMKKLRKKKGKS
jgi:hypothetical protein